MTNWYREFFRFRVRFWGLFHAAGFLAVLGTLAGILGPLAWWLDLGVHFRVQYAVIFAILCGFYSIGRKWSWAVGAGFFFLANLVPILLLLFPRAEPISGIHLCYRALLINVNTQTGNPSAVMRMIMDVAPDFIVLEEINDDWMQKLAPALTNYPHRVVEPREDNFGIALLSRLPWDGAQVLYIGEAGVPSVAARVRLGSQPVLVLGTHPLPPGGAEYTAYRNNQLERLADFVKQTHEPVLLIGDLNVTPWSHYFKQFLKRSGLKNSSQGRGLYPSWPAFAWPLGIPIDHVLHSEEIRVLRREVGGAVGSDHYPVIVDFTLH